MFWRNNFSCWEVYCIVGHSPPISHSSERDLIISVIIRKCCFDGVKYAFKVSVVELRLESLTHACVGALYYCVGGPIFRKLDDQMKNRKAEFHKIARVPSFDGVILDMGLRKFISHQEQWLVAFHGKCP